MTFEELTDDTQVIDNEQRGSGIGRVTHTKNGLVFVWFDEIETTVHYDENDIKHLKPYDK